MKKEQDWKEERLLKQAERLQTEISFTSYPFIEPSHPAYDVLTIYMIEKAKEGNYDLIMAAEQRVSQLTDQRIEIMEQLRIHRKRKEDMQTKEGPEWKIL